IHLCLEGVRLNEAVDPHRAEEMSDAFTNTAGRDFHFLTKSKRRSKRSPICRTEDATQHIDHHRQAVALMPAMFTVRTERQECSTFNHLSRLCSNNTVAIDSPAGRDRTAFPSSYFDLSIRSSACCHVDHDGWLLLSGEADSNRVSAKHALRSPQGSNQLG